MAIDASCTAPQSDFEIPTLKPSEPLEACDRTDYSAVDGLADRITTSEALSREVDRLIDEARVSRGRPPSTRQRNRIRRSVEQAYDLNQYEIASPAVFRIDQNFGNGYKRELGSAFSIGKQDSSCLLVTDHHVVASDDGRVRRDLLLRSQDGKKRPLAVTRLDAAKDLALVKVPIDSLSSCPALALADNARGLKPLADRVVAVGHPSGSNHQFISAGEVLETYRKWRDIGDNPETRPWADNPTIEIDAQAIGGMSGGPAMADGEVAGVVQARVGTGALLFTPVENLQVFLRQPDNVAPPRPPRVPQGSIGVGPLDCDYDEAISDIRRRIDLGQLESADFSGTSTEIKSVYKFKDGTQYNLNDATRSCQQTRVFVGL